MSDEHRVVVTGMGVLSALGDSPRSLHEALCAGRSGLRPVVWEEADGMPALHTGRMEFDPRTYLPEGNLRPLDRTGRMAVAAAGLALADAGWSAEALEETEVGFVAGTMFGSVHTIAGFDRRAMVAGPNYAKPMEFANSVINAASGQTAIWHNLWGINATISGGAASGAQAIAYATDLIRTGRATSLVAGGVDELCFESAYGFYRVGLLYEPGADDAPPAPPFDARRSGLALGEAGAFLMLEDAAAAAARGATVLAEVRGHGDAYDESRGEDEEATAAALARAVEIALELSGLKPVELSCVSASANGDPRGDRGEAAGLARALGEEAARLPVVAIKAMLGETLGASGALQAVTLIESMRAGRLPGTAGLQETEAGFPLGGVTAECVSVEPGHGLLTARSLGASCALVIEVGP